MHRGTLADKADPLSAVQLGCISVSRGVSSETDRFSDADRSVTMGLRPMNWNEWIEVSYVTVNGCAFITLDSRSWTRSSKSIIGSSLIGFELMEREW